MGVDEKNEKPVRWTKQKVDLIVNGEVINKSRPSIEPQIYPTAKIIGDLKVISGNFDSANSIFVDEVESFIYEDDVYGLSAFEVDALITSGDINNVAAAATATVSAAGTISALTITEPGTGYSGNIDIGIEAPSGIEKFVGLGTTATATATVLNGQVTPPLIGNPGAGYTHTNPPDVIISLPPFQTEKITSINNVEGFTGIITGISSVTVGTQTALKFFFRATKNTTSLLAGYPVFIQDTKIGHGVTSVGGHNSSVVGIGTTFLDNIYQVASITNFDKDAEIICNVKNGSNIGNIGLPTTGFHYPAGITTSTSLGRLSWGRLYNGVRSSNPISIGVTGLTVNTGLSTFPTIQRKNYDPTSHRGLRSTGAIRVFGL